jgi:hypothetical protein
MLEALKGLGDRRAAAAKAFEAEAQEIVKPCLQEFMTKHPSVKAIGWAQYTPYFNDGDPCTFSLRGLHASAMDEREEDLYGDGWHEIYGDPEEGFAAEDWQALKDLEGALGSLEDELHAVFGDHVRVIVTPDGVDVEEYSHD